MSKPPGKQRESPPSDDSESDPSSIHRRSMMAALGTAAAGGALAPSVAGDLGDRTPSPALELSTLDLPSWRQTERHEAATSPVANPRSGSNVLGRKIVSVKRNLSQINMKLWENDDAARAECGNEVGHQHRFMASTMLTTAEKADLSWHYDEFVETTSQLPSLRNPPIRGRYDHGQMSTQARIKDGAPNEDACGPVTFRINNVYWNRIPLSATAKRGDDDDADTLYGDYGTDDLRADVDEFQRGRGAMSPYMPEDESGVAALAMDALNFASNTTGPDTAVAGHVLDALSGYHEAFEYASRAQGLVSKVSGYAGHAVDIIAFLSELDGLLAYEGQVQWGDDDVFVASDGYGGGAVDVQFVDFTITVPPGEADPGGTTVEVVQNYGLDPESRESPNYFDGHRPDRDGQVKADHTWEIEIPAYSTDDFDGVSELPTVSVDGASGRMEYAEAPSPDPSITIQRSGTTEADGITFEADADGAGSEATYRWRVYKNGGKVRPATFVGPTATLEDATLARGDDPTVEAFGPGEYVAELSVRNEYGKTGRTAERFSVDPVPKEGTEIAIEDSLIEVTEGERVPLSVEGSVGPDDTADSIDLIEWEIQYPSAVTGGVVDRNDGTVENMEAGVDAPSFKPPKHDATKEVVEHTFDYPGIYRAAVRVYALDDSFTDADKDPSNVQAVYYSQGDRIHADKRDVTVVVTPAENSASTDAGTAPGPGPVPWGGQYR